MKMRFVTALILISIFSLKDFNCEAKKRRNHKAYLRKSRSQQLPVLTTPHTGQDVRIIHDVTDDITSGTVEVFVRNGFGIVCKNGWDVSDADVFCKQMGFKRGAAAIKYGQNGHDSRPNFVLDNVSCDRNSKTLQECDWSNPGHCGSTKISGVVCKENVGCPEGWIAGPTGCYKVSHGKTSKQEFAINKCLSQGGHLVTIETEEENHFISNALWNFSEGPILIGGVLTDDGWMWQKVNNDNGGGHTMTYIPIENSHWFPGWQPGDILHQPEDKKKQHCIYLSNMFHTPNGTAINVGYHFWYNDRCTSTRKRLSSGFHYICERPLETTEDTLECINGNGADYRGTTSFTSKYTPCIKWSKSTDINPDTYPNMGLGDHNYCRNPDSDESPWCWVSDGEFEFCDIPQCSDIEKENADANTVTECEEEEFKCSNNKCIPLSWICDMENDCINGEDEQQNCAYKLELFKVSKGLSVSGHVVETYNGATNETCAKYCFDSTRFVCKSFSFSPETRECKLSDQNTENIEFRSSRRESIFEMISQLVGCHGMFKCNNGRCTSKDDVCDGQDHCGDFSDEQNCGGEETVSVRLGGGTESEGRVEVFYRGEWGVVCDDQWDVYDAKVVCRMLGYMGDAVAIMRSSHGKGGKKFILDEVECRGDEENIAQCGHSGWKKHDCYSWEVAAVQCSEETRVESPVVECNEMVKFTCTIDNTCITLEEVCDGICQCTNCTDEQQCEPMLELVDGSDYYEGRVEITINGVRGTICDDGFDDTDAAVICNSLGFSSGVTSSAGLFGPGNGTIWMDKVYCLGNETDITQCMYLGPREQNCGHDEDVGVICMTDDNAIGVTLEGGDSEYSGRVILTRYGENGTICDDKWDDEDAQVICRMLGMSGGVALDGEFFGRGDQYLPIFLDNVECTGDEDSIDQCSHNDWLVHNCDHTEDAGVKCFSSDIEATTMTFTMPTTTVAADTSTSKRESASTNAEDCWDNRNKAYDGKVAVTENGFECQRWSLNSPHHHKHHDDSLYPDGSVKAAKNYCRTPDGDSQPWCYTTHPDERWGYCHIPKCKNKETTTTPVTMTTTTVAADTTTSQRETASTNIEDCWDNKNKSYDGKVAVTENGFECQRWSLNSPHQHKHHDDSLYPDGSVKAAKNYCRTPDGDSQPWCYTTHPDERWGYCYIPKCKNMETTTTPVTMLITTVATDKTTSQQETASTNSEDCWDNKNKAYDGKVAVTENGFECQRWSLNSPHQHKHHDDSLYPDGSVKAAKNYCRTPDEDSQPWCYTTNPDERWGYCYIPNCKNMEATTTPVTMPITTIATDKTTSQQETASTNTEDCWDNRNKAYDGKVAVTENGFECQSWSLNSPHQHKHHDDSLYPDGSVKAAKNYCRTPDGDPQPWCYTTHPDERWGYCYIPKCKKECFSIASRYNGSISTTVSGHTCQKWSLNTPQKHKYSTRDDLFPDGSVDAAGNNCRAPDDDATPWCYTTNPKVRWEFCNISTCSGKFDFDATCGQRPLEISRSRRYADNSRGDSEDESYAIDDLEQLPYQKLAKIYGGSRASYGMYPWQAGIRRRMSGLLSYHLHHCGGTIIGEYWVLSAAHCFRDISKGQIVVRAGDLNTDSKDKYEQDFDVENIFVHHRYDEFGFDNDIALLKLSPVRGHGILFNDYVQPACLPNATTEYVPGKQCLISGWGEMEGEKRSDYLRAARVPLVDQYTCSRLHKHSISSNMVCAGYLAGGTDTCSGDSGGPLVCNMDSKYTIMGVVSFGEGCAMPNSPGVYARVTSFIPWIRKILARY